jgi:hypothetical protein
MASWCKGLLHARHQHLVHTDCVGKCTPILAGGIAATLQACHPARRNGFPNTCAPAKLYKLQGRATLCAAHLASRTWTRASASCSRHKEDESSAVSSGAASGAHLFRERTHGQWGSVHCVLHRGCSQARGITGSWQMIPYCGGAPDGQGRAGQRRTPECWEACQDGIGSPSRHQRRFASQHLPSWPPQRTHGKKVLTP